MSKNLVIFDGSNFYHKAKKLAPNVHLTGFNYRKLAEALTGSNENVIEYCVGEIKPQKLADEKAGKLYAGQQALFYNLQKQNIVVKKGFMLKSQGIYHEKGVDVRIATDIVRGALKNEYDNCFIISSDSDVLPAIETAVNDGKIIVYVAFEGSVVSKALAINCSKTVFITKTMVENCSQ
jgi:uncharacterized LabA/DUF88 family protein